MTSATADTSTSLTCFPELADSPLPPRSPTLWPTPKAANPGSRPNGKGGKILEEEVAIAEGLRVRGEKMWPTPAQFDVSGGPYPTELTETGFVSYHPQPHGAKLSDAVRVSSGLPTPKSNPSPAPSITATFPIRSALAPSRMLHAIRSLSDAVYCRMLSAGASPASRTVAPESGSPVPTTGTCGESVGECLATYDHASHSLRMFQGFLLLSEGDSSTESLATWPRCGLLVNGKLYQLPPLVPRTGATECGCSAGMSWLTPSSNEDAAGTVNGNMQTMLSHQVQGRFSGPPSPATGPADPEKRSTDGSRRELWASPQSRDFRTSEGNEIRWENPERSRNLNDQTKAMQGSGKLNPHWVFALMGYPPLWAEIGHKFTTASRNSRRPETQLFPKSPPSS